jgi:hypothetical protein
LVLDPILEFYQFGLESIELLIVMILLEFTAGSILEGDLFFCHGLLLGLTILASGK